ncbi:MAG: hypothetical protein ACI9Y1_003400 [Lentisphaeria bacterium]|jgi:hypothetical protein
MTYGIIDRSNTLSHSSALAWNVGILPIPLRIPNPSSKYRLLTPLDPENPYGGEVVEFRVDDLEALSGKIERGIQARYRIYGDMGTSTFRPSSRLKSQIGELIELAREIINVVDTVVINGRLQLFIDEVIARVQNALSVVQPLRYAYLHDTRVEKEVKKPLRMTQNF